MTASDVAELERVRDAAGRLAADCSSLLRKRGLSCDSARLCKLSRQYVKAAHAELLFAFVSEADVLAAKKRVNK